MIITSGAGYSSDNDTKVKQMLEKVTLNGEPLSIPYTVDDLPEGFTLDEDVNIYTNDEGEEFVYSYLCYDGVHITTVALSNYYDGQPVEEFKGCSISFSIATREQFSGWVQIVGIANGSTMDEVLNKFGEPTSYEFVDNAYAYYYWVEGSEKYISFIGDEEGMVISSFISDED